jgi:hypothetical protein
LIIDINGKWYETKFAKRKFLRIPITFGHTLVAKEDNTLHYDAEAVEKYKYAIPTIEEYSGVEISNKIISKISPIEKNKTQTFLAIHTESYHHFLIDTVGAILFLKNNSFRGFDIKNIMVTRGKKTISQMLEEEDFSHGIKNFHQEVFDHFRLGKYIDTLVDLRDHDPLKFEKVLVVNQTSFPLDSFCEILKLFKAEIPKDAVANKKIYVSRKTIKQPNKGREVLDEEILQKYFENHGYTTVFFEDHSFEEQLNIMASASHVITYNGSSMVNTVFMQEGTNILEIRNSLQQQHDAYMFWSRWFNIKHKVLRCFGANTSQEIIDAIESDPEIVL